MQLIGTILILAMCAAPLAGYEAVASADPADRRALPHPRRDGGASLAQVLATRRSVRAFATRDLDDAELGQLLWSAQGATDGHRTAPSAGALYPLTLYVVDARGVWRYEPDAHAVTRMQTSDRRTTVARATYSESAVAGAPLAVVITARVAVTAVKYGARAERYATLEAGHAAQNLLLTASALGLAAVPVGAFDDSALRKAIGVDASTTMLYVIPVGAPP